MADTGNSSTIAFGTSGFTANYHRLGGTEQSGPAIKVSHLGTTGNEEYIPGDLAEPGTIDAEFEYNPNEQPPLLQAAETITVTYPVPAGLNNGATLSGTGFITSRSTPTLENNVLMVGSFTVQWDGKTGPTFTDAS